MLPKTFTEMGILPGYGFMQLLYNPVANKVILQAQWAGKGWRPERLYCRRSDHEKYTLVGAPNELISQEFPVVSVTKPLLAFNSLQHSFSLDETGNERHAANWDSVTIVDLDTLTKVQVIDKRTLQLPKEFTDGWINSVLSFAAQEDELCVTAALSKNNRRSIDYFLARLHITEHTVHPVAFLPAVVM